MAGNESQEFMRSTSEHKHSRGKAAAKREIIPKELLNITQGFIVVFAPDGTVVEVNGESSKAMKVPEEDFPGLSLYDFVLPEDVVRLKQLAEDCLEHGRPVSGQAKLLARDNTIVDAEISLSRYPGNVRVKRQYCILIGRDVSEEKKKELDLLRFSNIAHYTINPVEITDPHGRIIYVNPAYERVSGYSKEELIGKNPNVFSSGKHPKGFWKQMWDTITAGKVWVGEIENRRRDGAPFFAQLLISPVIDGTGKIVGFFGVHRDISGQKNLEQQLIHAQKMESIGMLAAGIAHEVGNPLTSISSLVQILQRETKEDFTIEKLELIKSQIARISRIIRDLVDFSRRSSYEVQMTDLNKSLHEAVEIVRVGKKAKEISFHVELDDNVPWLPLVPDQVEQVFINILINAVDAVYGDKQPSQQRAGRIEVRSTVADSTVVITVRDNGKGIPEEMRAKIFEPFFTTKKVGEGTGLGLWVSYGIIKSFKGNIAVDSVEGQGTTFTIRLPLRSELT